MNNKILKELVDQGAIRFMTADEKEYDEQYNTFIKLNTVVEIDLSNSEDYSLLPPKKLNT